MTKAELLEAIFEKELSKNNFGFYKVEHNHSDYKKDKELKTLCLLWYTTKMIKNGDISLSPTIRRLPPKSRFDLQISIDDKTDQKTQTKLSAPFFLF